MEDNRNVYCRFCVKPKHSSVLDLKVDIQNYENVLKQLGKLSLNIDFTSHLPTTVCTECYDLLTKAYTFVNQVEESQLILHQVFLGVDFESDVKLEFETNDCEQYVDSFNSNTKSIDIKTLKCEAAEVDNDAEWKEVFDNITIENINKNLWDLYDWTCKFCMNKFKSMDDLRNHCKEVHGECNGFYCVDCERGFDKFTDFISHVSGHRIHLKKSCPYCDIKVPKSMHIKKHTATHMVPPHAVCISCGEIYENAEDLAIHQQQYKALTLKQLKECQLKCQICQKQFKSPGGCWTHKQTHNLNRKRSHICEMCGKAYHGKYALLQHVRTHNETRQHECKLCSKTFLSMHKLRAHVSIHTGIKPFTCEQCGRSFRLKHQLRSHSIIHTDEMPFKCDVCSKEFKFRSVLKIHERQHTGVKPYACDDCSKVFTNWSNYNKHMNRKHKTKVVKKVVKIVKNDDTEQWENDIMLPLKRGKKSKNLQK